jgi:hypothetical protein
MRYLIFLFSPLSNSPNTLIKLKVSLPTTSNSHEGHVNRIPKYIAFSRYGIHKDSYFFEFEVHGSVHLGNVYVQMKVQLDVHGFISILYSSLFFSLRVSCAICTHPQQLEL